MTGYLVPIEKSRRRSKQAQRARKESKAAAKPEAPKPPPLLAGQAQRDLQALEAAETGHSHPAFQRERVEATPPPAAVNHATTPASAARRLTSRHMKVGGAVAAGVGAAGAGGYLINRKVKQRHQELERVVGKRDHRKGMEQGALVGAGTYAGIQGVRTARRVKLVRAASERHGMPVPKGMVRRAYGRNVGLGAAEGVLEGAIVGGIIGTKRKPQPVPQSGLSKGLPRAVANGGGGSMGYLLRNKNTMGRAAAKYGAGSPGRGTFKETGQRYKAAVRHAGMDADSRSVVRGERSRQLRANLLSTDSQARRDGSTLGQVSGLKRGYRGRVGSQLTPLP